MQLILGDCLEKLKELEDNSVDSVVTDPPYGISFMGKKWDYDVPSKEIWKEVLRVLKPGGHALVACGTRTQHRMAVNLEDAGFEIRDIVAWVYGSGFPKSMNIGKSIEAKELTGSSNKTAFKYLDGKKTETKLGYNKNNKQGDFRPNDYNGRETTVEHILHTESAKKWEGWGTALKPAMELWTLCRKPLAEPTVAENVLKYGTGGINIDGCRVGTETINIHNAPKGTFAGGEPDRGSDTNSYKDSVGRFPANLIHDGSDEVVGLFPVCKQAKNVGEFKQLESMRFSAGGEGVKKQKQTNGEIISASASRFFYCAKASRKERNVGLDGFEKRIKVFNGQSSKQSKEMKGVEQKFTTQPASNFHPTVKPVSLMRYLCRLITPKNGVVLDPFMGSGTTGIGAKLEGFDFIGIEIDEDYLRIAQARIDAWKADEQLKLVEH